MNRPLHWPRYFSQVVPSSLPFSALRLLTPEHRQRLGEAWVPEAVRIARRELPLTLGSADWRAAQAQLQQQAQQFVQHDFSRWLPEHLHERMCAAQWSGDARVISALCHKVELPMSPLLVKQSRAMWESFAAGHAGHFLRMLEYSAAGHDIGCALHEYGSGLITACQRAAGQDAAEDPQLWPEHIQTVWKKLWRVLSPLADLRPMPVELVRAHRRLSPPCDVSNAEAASITLRKLQGYLSERLALSHVVAANPAVFWTPCAHGEMIADAVGYDAQRNWHVVEIKSLGGDAANNMTTLKERFAKAIRQIGMTARHEICCESSGTIVLLANQRSVDREGLQAQWEQMAPARHAWLELSGWHLVLLDCNDPRGLDAITTPPPWITNPQS